VLGDPGQVGGEALGTDIVQAFGDNAQGVIHLRAVGASPLAPSLSPLQSALHQPDEALAVQFGDQFHLVKKVSPFCAVGLPVALLHSA